MTASILNGKHVASVIQTDIQRQTDCIKAQGHRAPGLAVIQLGNHPASSLYVTNKRKACEQVGFVSFAYDLPGDTPEQALLELIDTLNDDRAVDGILVQMPLPPHVHPRLVIERIHPAKDVDGFHPYNLGRLAQGHPGLRPCTPYGVIQLLKHYHLALQGKHVVVLGTSNIVGRPMVLELLLAQATISSCNSLSQQTEALIRLADVVILATGVLDVINTDWLNCKQIVIDVGIHRQPDGTIRGDIDFAKAQERVAWITPVPGGIGPMTISMLLKNTLAAYVQTRT